MTPDLEELAAGDANYPAQQYQQHVSLHEDVAAFAQLSQKHEPFCMPAHAPAKSPAIKRQKQAAEEDPDDTCGDQFSNLSAHEQQLLPILMRLPRPDRVVLLSLAHKLGANIRWRSCQDLDDYLQRFEVCCLTPSFRVGSRCNRLQDFPAQTLLSIRLFVSVGKGM